ncbi:MAG: serine/threonine protein kinase [Planctomycetes bacterium]|nr:serine/threonine protein kinase [Planctomycetota bacterium]
MSAASRRISALFAAAVDLAPAARRELLDRECADDPALRAAVERLLAADGSSFAAVLEAAVPVGLRLPEPGELVAGRYRVLERVGIGGMGVVFAAEQQEPRRRVALKCLRPEFATPELQARFRREAVLLGRLQHPGIVPILEAGVAAGTPPLPFLAMEFVAGRPLAASCQGLPLREQLELLAQVAEAVAHAHERGVVHRDLKPGNVLVESQSHGLRARVLDFGVARLVDESATLHTRTQQLVGTLAYLSPEQVAHGSASADARSDVWALGVTAFEILTGRLPLPLQGCTLAEAARVLRDDEPLRLERVAPALRGDLATIVHKALAKDPALRYADAAALAQDLRALLADQPITARPPGRWYRATRFAKRHRGLVAGLGAAFLALTIGLVSALWFAGAATAARDRAEARTRELRGLLRAVVDDVDRDLEPLAGATPARRRLLATGLQFADGLAADAGDAPEVLLDVAGTYLALATVQGVPGASNLGDVDGALATVARAEALVDRALAVLVARGHPGTEALQVRLQALEVRESVHRALGQAEARSAALVALERTAAAIAAAKAAAGPAAAARATAARARERADVGDGPAALAGFTAAVAAAEAALQAGAAVGERRRLAALQASRAQLLQRSGDLPGARAALEAAVAAQQQVLETTPGVPSLRGLAAALCDLGGHLVQFERDPAAGLPHFARARELLAGPVAEEPQNTALQRLWLLAEFGSGDALCRLRRHDEALPVLERYIAAMEAFAARPGQQASRRDVLAGRQQLALLLGRMGRREAADAVLDQALVLARAEAARQPGSALAEEDLALTLGVAGAVGEGYANDARQEAAVRAVCAARAVACYEEQLRLLQQMAEHGRLAVHKRAMLDALPAKLERLRAIADGR